MVAPSGRKRVALVVALALIAIAARAFWFSDARVIHRRLDALAETASVTTNETDIDRLARAARLGTFVTDDVMIRSDVSSFVGGKQAVVGLALQGAAADGPMTVAFDDVQISVTDPATATVLVTVRVTTDNPQVEPPRPRQVNATLSKVNGLWLLSRAEVLRTLE
jgi:hypothetical protein